MCPAQRNFIGCSPEDIARARPDWMNGDRFGVVKGYGGPSLPSPELPTVPRKARENLR
ncbi:pirin [Streptomyces sp. NPDC058657]|uniref:pirin n=1 Tax=unclassified Streptomyces TaxID=2593676 RepID=UPI0036510B82